MMNVQHVQTKVTTTSSLIEKKHYDSLANRQRHNETIATKNDQVSISQQGWKKYLSSLQLKQGTNDDPLSQLFRQFYEEYNSVEAIKKRELEQLEKENAYNRLEDEFSLKVKYEFPENTLQYTIKQALEGKVENASLYAAELAAAIRGSVSMPEKSMEERAAYREMALKQARYIAEHYFDNKQEASSFMNEIIKYYENDVLREKGYVVIDNSDLTPFKKYSSPVSNGKMKEKYAKEIIEEFELHEQQVEEQIKTTKLMLESFVWENGRVTGPIEEQPNYLVEVLKWNQNMLNLFL